ncbi:MAG: pyridoxamine 5'-phosphate oxidase family protein [Rickettsiales bacterium]|jgi:general stress protein 26|nr:pyridoxamine 5'-phosphate oxidase family protein [Rickettsiales bacterium]
MDDIKDILGVIRACPTVQLATFALDGFPETRTVMNAMNSDAEGFPLHFLTSTSSHKIEQLRKNPHCCLYFLDIATRHAATLFGTISEISDPARKVASWRPDWTGFGYGGPSDPEYDLLEFSAAKYKFYIGKTEHTGDINV